MTFVEEYKKLQLKMPRLSAYQIENINSNYVYNCKHVKNCYLIANAVENEDCMYGRDIYDSKNCVDCDHIKGCTLCYGCLNAQNCYNCDHFQDCSTCTDCQHGYFLKGCQNCVGCVGLKQQKFHIFNKSYNEKEYYEKLKTLNEEDIKTTFEKLKTTTPRVGVLQENSENFTGNCVYHSRNIIESYDIIDCEDCGYILEGKEIKDSYDITILEYSELCYEISSCHKMHNCNFCYFSMDCSDMEYGLFVVNCHNCFGCMSIKHKQYYILNKPYEKETYFKEVARIKDELKSQGLYGQWLTIPPFKREETLATWKST
ncbi:hypothetical protein HZC20_00830 [Candidatus Peregrinibacteria bacterium]|nr:hypothetical protein [Candidatus Peregrinibacteria bacterium]